MFVPPPLSISLVAEAVVEEQLKYHIDEEGNIRISFSRRKGKDLEFYVSSESTTFGVLSISCLVHRYFHQSEFASLLMFCNRWNRERRIPKSYISDPDADGDYWVNLNHSIFCTNGITRELIKENLTLFIQASMEFWDELDSAI
jgi:hypothetical protein